LTGKRRRLHLTAPTREQLEDKISAETSGTAAPHPERVAHTLTVGDWLAEWVEDGAGESVADATFDNRELIVKRWLIPAIGDVFLARLTGEVIDERLASMTAPNTKGVPQPPGDETRWKCYSVLRTALSAAVKKGRIPRNPAVDDPSCDPSIRQPPPPHVDPLTPREQASFLAAIHGEHDEARWLIGLLCGLRQSEVLGLTTDDIDLGTRTIRVSYQLSRATKKRPVPRRVKLKTHASQRTVPLPGVAVEALEQLYQGRWGESEPPQGAFLFVSRTGDVVRHRNDRRRFGVLVRKAGILRDVRVHDLRHTTATNLLAVKVSDRVVQLIMGWSSIAMAQRYQHPAEDAARDAILAAATVAESRVPAPSFRSTRHDVSDRAGIVVEPTDAGTSGTMTVTNGEGRAIASTATLTV